MKWTHDFGEPFPVLAFSQDEVKILIGILKGRVRREVFSRYEKYKDVHESGEATERQIDLMNKYEDQLRLIDRIIEA